MTETIRVMLADDHTIVRAGLAKILEDAEIDVVAQASDALEAVEVAIATRPQVAILDLSMPRLSGLEMVRRIRKAVPLTRILILTAHHEEEYIVPLVKAGAAGYLVKDSAATDLITAVEALVEGDSYFGPQAAKALAEQLQNPTEHPEDPYGALTAREREVFHLVIDGLTTKEVAQELDVSVKTAENHRTRLMQKLGVHSSVELVRYAVRHGLLT